MVSIYILELEESKYYVGKTTNHIFRIEKHFNSNGSAWTKKYKPTSVLEIIHNCDDFDEDKYTLKFMEKYGINNVRGGTFCEIKLSDNNILTLNQMLNTINDKCYICGKKDHFANECKNKTLKKEKKPTINLNDKCDCPTSYFSPHRRDKYLLNKVISYFEDEDDNIDKLVIKQNEEINSKETDENKNCCFRCGRNGHYISDCYASKDIKGYYLK